MFFNKNGTMPAASPQVRPVRRVEADGTPPGLVLHIPQDASGAAGQSGGSIKGPPRPRQPRRSDRSPEDVPALGDLGGARRLQADGALQGAVLRRVEQHFVHILPVEGEATSPGVTCWPSRGLSVVVAGSTHQSIRVSGS
jgi:hypothetical protein